MSMRSFVALARIVFPASLIACAACSGSSDTVIVLPGEVDYFEYEPNDTAGYANALGLLQIGDELAIHGSIDCYACDPADGFKFSTSGPVALQFVLSSADGVSDLDLCAFDPSIAGYFLCYENGGSMETGTILLGGAAAELHLVVSAFSGGGAYTLWVDVVPLDAALATSEPQILAPRNQGAADYAPHIEPEPALVRFYQVELDAHGAPIAALEVQLADGQPIAQRALELNRR
ncbi:MAG: hypothetical protein EPO68_03060 [Planctomycetota bacterium]|nr:MAG: hypothetical protein EPO68_03060 [Planctomycetota bacterium]